MSYLLIFATIVFTVAGQLLVKAGMHEVGALPKETGAILGFALQTLINAKVIAGLSLAVIAALCWTGAVSLSDLSFAYPFMALAIVLVLALSGYFFGEVVPLARWLGVGIVCVGLVVAATG
ncbi:MAG: hypothetical protein M3437_19325 [Chloroflexota bacterium]|nr:hypothetical protein [Chloroflexota bacterium]MDQ5866675.1 hypothetical protein [Chloroflexota bacterium]